MPDISNILKNFTVLCVEDENDVREELAQFLQRRVKTLYLASNGKEGLASFIEHKPDIVVTDILMPLMNGLDMSKEIKQLSPDTPIIITTAFNESDFFLRAIELGIDKYVLKPVKARKLVGSLEEIAWLLKAKRELQLSATVFNASTEGITVTDADNKIIAVNPAFSRITGYKSEEILGQDPKILSSGRQDSAFYQTMWQELKENRHWQGEIWNRRKSGEIFPEWINITIVTDESDKILFHVAVFSDITVRKQAEQKLYHLAHYDPLTKLPNRTLLQDRVQQAIAQTARYNHKHLALLFVDLDRFKFVNDAYGHIVGDLLLQEVASRLKASVRNSDTVSRLGGDEFVILVPELEHPDDAALIAQHIIHSLAEPFLLHDKKVQIGCSIGISLYPNDGKDVTELMKTADAAMYTVKGTGRNNYRFFQTEMNARLLEKISMEQALRNALEQGQFELQYQPLFNLETQKMEGVEALLRWHHPDGRVRTAHEFIALAEEIGLIFSINEWMLRTAITEVKSLQQAQSYEHLKLAIHISAKQLTVKDFAKQLANLLLEQQFSAHCLELEISESALLNASEDDLDVLKQLHELGVAIVINDFGFGYASLLHLNYLPIDRLKIDHSFVINNMTDKDNFTAIAAITAMAKSLSLKVTIGDLETPKQMELIKNQSDLIVQGRHFCPPMALIELQQQLKQLNHLEVLHNVMV